LDLHFGLDKRFWVFAGVFLRVFLSVGPLYLILLVQYHFKYSIRVLSRFLCMLYLLFLTSLYVRCVTNVCCVDGIRYIQDSRSPGRDFNPKPPECDAGGLTTQSGQVELWAFVFAGSY
jgi:hypothetical protein